MPSVLIVDDEPNILRTVKTALRVEGYDTDTAATGPAALERLGARSYDLALLDVQLPEMNGLEVLRRARTQGIDVPVIVMSGHGTIEMAVQATRLGARDFLEKPLSTDRLLLAIGNALEVARLKGEIKELKEAAGPVGALLGDSPVMRELRESGMTMVVVSHELSFARAAADRVVFMDHGQIVEQGAPERIFSTAESQRVRDFVATITGHH